jgi:hypothetical protein
MVAHEVPQLSPKSHFDPWNESGDRSLGRLSFSTGCVLPDCPGKTGLTGFPNLSDQFSPVGCREGFLSRKVSVMLRLFLFKGGEVLEVFWGSFGFEGVLGSFWTKPA